jgi:hypothetical protein
VKQFDEIAQTLNQKSGEPVMNFDETEKDRFTSPFTLLGKKELCEALGWSRPRLDRRIATDKNFPVLQRGNQSGGWQFDLTDVVKHLAASSDVNSSAVAASSTPLLSPEEVRNVFAEIARIQAIRRVIETLVSELGASLDRLSASLGREGAAASPIDAEALNCQTH